MTVRLPSLFAATAACAFAVACGGGGSGAAAPSPVPDVPAGGVPAGWRLVWADEFDVDGLPDAAKWDHDTYRNVAGWYNAELQYYAANRPENARVEGGKLVITARRERLSTAADFGGQDYTSARLVTRGRADWTYGFFEVRAKLPCGMGTWPAIWMLGSLGTWPADGEIDIMEQRGNAPGTILGHAHMKAHHGSTGRGSTTQVNDTCNSFHNYQVHWTADAIAWGVDDATYFRYVKLPGATYATWPFDFPQHLLMNIAVGGHLGGTPDASVFPARMEVDYVRVYQP
ncbi:glycoside hydrolase family 16 protein [Piscinibacter sp.]|uniref:glycoside hydrolase family 16 protein n=1 Tax=Piscinibacter sp. TaxID=1903157 RepID=UPI002D02A825|nr:glycoside hydrolase family 16 protein [Albitalea sp.]HUG23443.1 glycoside hydrolase family 16 protein [Albitalea sp.]